LKHKRRAADLSTRALEEFVEHERRALQERLEAVARTINERRLDQVHEARRRHGRRNP
jgi:hypothetical protein